MKCPHCGEELPDGTTVCSHCGSGIGLPGSPQRIQTTPEEQSLNTQAVISLVLGFLSVGCFPLGAVAVFLGLKVNQRMAALSRRPNPLALFGVLLGAAGGLLNLALGALALFGILKLF